MSLTEITLDWDYRDWSRFLRGRGKSQEFIVRELANSPIRNHAFVASYRRSSNGRVHVQLKFRTPIPEPTTFVIRALLFDDRYRVLADMVRWAHGDQINRLWDSKWSKGKLRRAGKWKRWFRGGVKKVERA